MAISFGAVGTVADSAGASTLTITLPTHSEDDLIILFLVHDYNSDTNVLTSVDTGYTLLAEHNTSGMAHQGAVYYKIAGASEGNATANYSSSTQAMSGYAVNFSGVDTSTPIDVGPSAWTEEDPDADASIDSPSVTTVADNAFLICMATADENDVFTVPTGMTLMTTHQYVNHAVASAYLDAGTAGATGAKSWTFGQSGDEMAAVSFAIKPAAVAGGSVSHLTLLGAG